MEGGDFSRGHACLLITSSLYLRIELKADMAMAHPLAAEDQLVPGEEGANQMATEHPSRVWRACLECRKKKVRHVSSNLKVLGLTSCCDDRVNAMGKIPVGPAN